MILLSSRREMICGSVGTGRRARLRILCSLRTCGFKSHLPHSFIRERVYQKSLEALDFTGFRGFLLSHSVSKKSLIFAPRLPHFCPTIIGLLLGKNVLYYPSYFYNILWSYLLTCARPTPAHLVKASLCQLSALSG